MEIDKIVPRYVEVPWLPPKLYNCKIFGHSTKNCVNKPVEVPEAKTVQDRASSVNKFFVLSSKIASEEAICNASNAVLFYKVKQVIVASVDNLAELADQNGKGKQVVVVDEDLSEVDSQINEAVIVEHNVDKDCILEPKKPRATSFKVVKAVNNVKPQSRKSRKNARGMLEGTSSSPKRNSLLGMSGALTCP
ncbi:hypothetical protein PTKIN_Ptkin01aG0049800 [Pterospermum kingtungense]